MLSLPDATLEAARIDGAGEFRIFWRIVLPVAIARFAGQQAIPFNQILAVSVVSIVPVIVLFLLLQRQIIAGLVRGAVR